MPWRKLWVIFVRLKKWPAESIEFHLCIDSWGKLWELPTGNLLNYCLSYSCVQKRSYCKKGQIVSLWRIVITICEHKIVGRQSKVNGLGLMITSLNECCISYNIFIYVLFKTFCLILKCSLAYFIQRASAAHAVPYHLVSSINVMKPPTTASR